MAEGQQPGSHRLTDGCYEGEKGGGREGRSTLALSQRGGNCGHAAQSEYGRTDQNVTHEHKHEKSRLNYSFPKPSTHCYELRGFKLYSVYIHTLTRLNIS